MIKNTLKTAAIAITLGVASLTWSNQADAGLLTSEVIFGSGNANGGFTIEQFGSLELGLRAKLRYNENGQAENTFPWDSADTYTFYQADGNAPSNHAIWNFEWSINTSWDDNGVNLNAYNYLIEINGDNGFSSSYNPFGALRNVSLGNNSTQNGGGVGRGWLGWVFGGTPTNYNVAQESVNIGFSNISNSGFDPQSLGMYEITLSAFQNGQTVGSNTIFVNMQSEPNAVSESATLALFSLGLVGLGALRRRKRS